MSYSFLYFLISFLLFIAFFLCLKKILGGCTFRKILRGIDKALSKSRLKQVFILAFFIVFTFAFIFSLSVAITSLYKEEYRPSFWNALGHFLNPGNFGKSNDLPEIAILFINIFGMILMTGLLISVLSNLLERRVDNIKNGRVFYNFRHHLVIIGYNKMAISLIRQFYEKYPDSEIVLQTIQDVPDVRHELFSYINTWIEDQLIVMCGNRNSLEDLERLKPHEAKEVYLLGEKDEHDHDSLSIECLKKINIILTEKKNTPEKNCHVLFENQSTYAILQQQDIQQLNRLNFIPFNFQEKWAEKAFTDCIYKNVTCTADHENIHYLPLDRVPIHKDSVHTVHLVVIGMSKMGIALGIKATHICHFPNFLKDKNLRTRITFIDKNADKEMFFLQGRYQSLFSEIRHSYGDDKEIQPDEKQDAKEYFTDIEWHFIKGEIENPVIQEKIERFSNEENTLLTVAVCLNDTDEAIAAGLYLKNVVYQPDKIKHFEQFKDIREKLPDEEQNKFNVQILIRQDTPYSILSMLKCTDKYRNVKPFGMSDNCLHITDPTDLDILAKKVHYVYDYYFNEKPYRQIPDSIPTQDKLNKKWNKIPTVEKWSNRYHAHTIDVKLRSFDLEELKIAIKRKDNNAEIIDLMSRVEHNRWNIEKLLLGFRPATGPEQNMAKSILKKNFVHPDIKKFEDIPEDTKEIDRMITRALPFIIKDIKQ